MEKIKNNIYRLIITGLIWCFAITVVNGQWSSSDRQAIRFRYLVEQNKLTEAAGLLKEFGPEMTNRTDLLKSLVIFYLQKGELDQAESYTTKLIHVNPSSGYFLRAKIKVRQGDLTGSMADLKSHLERSDHFTELKIKMDPDFAALDHEREWIRLWQTDWYQPWENDLAEISFTLKQGDEASAAGMAMKFTKKNPDLSQGWLTLAKCEYRLGQSRQSRQAFERAINNSNTKVSTLEEAYRFRMNIKQWQEALSVLDRLIRIDSTEPKYRIDRTLCRMMSGDSEDVNSDLRQLNEAGIQSTELDYQAAQTVMQNNPSEALRFINRAMLAADKLDTRFYNTRAAIYTRMKKPDLALPDYGMSLDINPDQPDVWFNRAELRLSRGDREGACHDWQRALRLGHRKAADRLYKFCR